MHKLVRKEVSTVNVPRLFLFFLHTCPPGDRNTHCSFGIPLRVKLKADIWILHESSLCHLYRQFRDI